ncbi:MAG: serine phosphatase RsbU (regulator of sigma subunit) [Parvicellaceae bacterium]|jgi:serine phosphatase RsbU (regulator of sigma subunit)
MLASIDTLLIHEDILKAEVEIETNFYVAYNMSSRTYAQSLEINYDNGIIRSLDVMGAAKDYLGDYAEAQRLNYEMLRIYELKGDENGVAGMNINIGVIHYYQSNYIQALEVTRSAKKYYQSINDSGGVSICHNNIANCYADKIEYDSALVYYFKALAIDKAQNVIDGQSLLMGNIGETYLEQEKYDLATSYLDSALSLAFKAQDEWQQSNIYCALGDLNSRLEAYDAANRYFNQSLKILTRINAAAELEELYELMADVYEKQGDPVMALKMLKLNLAISDSLYSAENSNKIAEMEVLHGIQVFEDQLKEKKLESQQRTFMFVILGVVLAAVLVFLILVLRNSKNRKRTNQALKQVNKHVEEKNREITDSINYAKRLQQAILPSMDQFKRNLEDSFVLFKPKDVVSGDFYWMEVIDDQILFAVGDCTGHGVPGALVSVVCSNALNSATKEFRLTDPAEILEKTKDLVIKTFERSGKNVRDGMDVSLCSYNPKAKTLKWAGANNPIWIVSDKEFKEADRVTIDEGNALILNDVKASRQPIGMYDSFEPFRQWEFQLKTGDLVYLLSDGFVDQFGGERSKKYKALKLKKFLMKISKERMNRQREMLTTEFDIWRGDLEQIDDVCILGLRI